MYRELDHTFWRHIVLYPFNDFARQVRAANCNLIGVEKLTFQISSRNLIHRNHIMLPAPQSGPDHTMFKFTGMVHFNFDDARALDDRGGFLTNPRGKDALKGHGTAVIEADYSDVIGSNKAIEPSQWTELVGLSNLRNDNHAVNAVWSIQNYRTRRSVNGHPDNSGTVFLAAGKLVIDVDQLLNDDSIIAMMTYDVTIFGRIVDYRLNI